jgi:hypothetical protein
MRTAIRSSFFSLAVLLFAHVASAQIGISISVNFGPPALPVYEQPICPADGYLWTPGYWSYDDDGGYYWVPGTWVQPPQVGFLWTPGYWGWSGSAFAFNEGYWGPQVGFYGGINYGFGYVGNGYEGGRWDGGHFSYNTYVNHVDTTIIHNTYNTTVVVNDTHVSYNGGTGGVETRPTPQQQSYAGQHHVPPVSAQTQQVQQARSNPQLRASANQGKPPIAATAKPGDFKSGVVASKQAGGEYKAPPANAARSNENRPSANANRPVDVNRPAANAKPEDKPSAEQPAPKEENKPAADRPAPREENKPAADRPAPKEENKPAADRPAPREENKPAADKPAPKEENKPAANKPAPREENKPPADKPAPKEENKPPAEKPN